MRVMRAARTSPSRCGSKTAARSISISRASAEKNTFSSL
jgi:hypothetical protein